MICKTTINLLDELHEICEELDVDYHSNQLVLSGRVLYLQVSPVPTHSDMRLTSICDKFCKDYGLTLYRTSDVNEFETESF